MDGKTKIIISLAMVAIFGLVIWLGFGQKYGIIQSCSATYETYVTAHYTERYDTICYSTKSDGSTNSYPCTEVRRWSKAASPIWKTKTINGQMSSNAVEPYISNHGFYINDVPPRDESLSRSRFFDGFRSGRKVSLNISVFMIDEYQGFKKEPSFYKSCELLRKNKQQSVIKTWYGFAYDTEMML